MRPYITSDLFILGNFRAVFQVQQMVCSVDYSQAMSAGTDRAHRTSEVKCSSVKQFANYMKLVDMKSVRFQITTVVRLGRYHGVNV